MSRGGFYGVYGRNGGGIYVYWPKLQESMRYIQGVKVKKLRTRDMAVQFVVNGLVNDYGVCRAEEIQVELLYANINFFLYLEKLRIPRMSFVSKCPYYIMA